ncbi:MAG: extracellular solute-binding protein [Polyangia bacterium]
MKNPSRRQFLGWTGAAAAGLGLHACEKQQGTLDTSSTTTDRKLPFAGQTLRVFIYSGVWEKTIREHFVPRFQAMTGATVIPDPGWWDSIPKLKASPADKPAFDLVLTDGTQGYPAIKEGMFQTIDMSKLTNKDKLAPSALDNWVYKESFGITFPESVMTLAYNKELVAPAPTSWGDLLDDRYRGKLGIYNSFYMSLYTFACMKVARDGKVGTAAAWIENDLDGVLAFAKANRDRVKYWWPTSTDMALNLSQKNCALGNMHSPDMLIAMKRDASLACVVPDADRAFVQFMWVIPKGTPNKELAVASLDFLIGEEMQTAFADNGSATPLLSVAEKKAASDPLWKSLYPSTKAQLAAVKYYPYDLYTKNWDKVVAAWDKEILRKG